MSGILSVKSLSLMGVSFYSLNSFWKKNVPGVLKRKANKNWGGGGGQKFLKVCHYKIFQKCSWGPETHTTFFDWGGGGGI